jgi:hypothetical protein
MPRTRFVFRPGHPKASPNGFVPVEELGDWDQPKQAKHADIMMDRHYENQKLVDGTDVGSRRKFKEYLHKTGYTTMDDFKDTWKKNAAERMQGASVDRKERREQIGRAIYEATKR